MILQKAADTRSSRASPNCPGRNQQIAGRNADNTQTTRINCKHWNSTAVCVHRLALFLKPCLVVSTADGCDCWVLKRQEVVERYCLIPYGMVVNAKSMAMTLVLSQYCPGNRLCRPDAS
ncbi:hypothetical protein ABBQ32_000383 [Trebouxia sp. C0010 RCD-2024]